MADISSYPIGTPSSGDMVPGTQVTKDSSGNTIIFLAFAREAFVGTNNTPSLAF